MSYPQKRKYPDEIASEQAKFVADETAYMKTLSETPGKIESYIANLRDLSEGDRAAAEMHRKRVEAETDPKKKALDNRYIELYTESAAERDKKADFAENYLKKTTSTKGDLPLPPTLRRYAGKRSKTRRARKSKKTRKH